MDVLTVFLNVLSTGTLIGAVIFAALQVRAANRTRSEQAALTIMNAIHKEGWAHSLTLLARIPDGATPADIDALGPAVEQAIHDYGLRLETVGYMVFRGAIGLRTIEDMIGGITVVMWRRLKTWVERDRERTASVRQYEWFQWLAERLEEHRAQRTAEPAYVAYTAWKQSDAVPTD